jgi:hypothetical protein
LCRRIYGYDAPGLIRAVIVDRVHSEDKVEHDFLAIGTYVYMKMKVQSNDVPILDIRGGELPGLVLRPRHCGFGALTEMVAGTLSNWRTSGVRKELSLEKWKSASAASA